jgi:hypothetical protein
MLFSVLFALLGSLASAQMTPEAALDGLLSTGDMRYITFLNAMQLMAARNLKTIVETGTARNGKANCGGDGCSTYLFSRWTTGNPGMTIDSVDISEEAVRQSAAACELFPRTNVHCSDSVKFLREFDRPIDLLYLDSYDFDASNPNPSQQHHLKEIVVAYDKLHKDSVVMVDDCGLRLGGKCALVELVLKELGWKVYSKYYQLVMVRDEDAPQPQFNSDLVSKSYTPACNEQAVTSSKYEDILLKVAGRLAVLEEKVKSKDDVLRNFMNSL